MKLRQDLFEKLIAHINRKSWWHVVPVDPQAYKKRGKFLASTYEEAEFWGCPLNDPQRVRVQAPLVGDEETIERALFGRLVSTEQISLRQRFALDKKMNEAAVALGYDSIVLMAASHFADFARYGKIPRSIELNVLQVE